MPRCKGEDIFDNRCKNEKVKLYVCDWCKEKFFSCQKCRDDSYLSEAFAHVDVMCKTCQNTAWDSVLDKLLVSDYESIEENNKQIEKCFKEERPKCTDRFAGKYAE